MITFYQKEKDIIKKKKRERTSSGAVVTAELVVIGVISSKAREGTLGTDLIETSSATGRGVK